MPLCLILLLSLSLSLTLSLPLYSCSQMDSTPTPRHGPWSTLEVALCRVAFDPRHKGGGIAQIRAAAIWLIRRAAVRHAERSHDRLRALCWEELSRKLHALQAFGDLSRFLGRARTQDLSLESLVRLVQESISNDRLWALEGIAQFVANRQLEDIGSVGANFFEGDLPHGLLGPLHTGLGVAVAENCLGGVDRRTPCSEIETRIGRILEICDTASRPGFRGMAFECTGFVSRFLHPLQVPRLDKVLSDHGETQRALFWHGVGRALYFLPSNLRPSRSAPWRAFEQVHREASDTLAELNMLAGLAWPVLLVNFRHPELIDAVLRTHHDEMTSNDAFSSGFSAALIMWLECTGDEAGVDRILHHEPESDEDLWRRIVHQPCSTALEVTHPRLNAENRLDALFSYPLT